MRYPQIFPTFLKHELEKRAEKFWLLTVFGPIGEKLSSAVRNQALRTGAAIWHTPPEGVCSTAIA